MNLQDELTKEFLSWVLGEEVLAYSNSTNPLNTIIVMFNEDGENYEDSLNLDTLTRLIKEKCLEEDIIIDTVTYKYQDEKFYYASSLKYPNGIGREICDALYTELEAVVKAGKYVREKKKLQKSKKH